MENEAVETTVKDDPIRKEISSRYSRCLKYYGAWMTEAKDDYNFALGDQWSTEDRQALKDQKRPCLTFNRIRPFISLISGYQRENSARIKIAPEGGEDKPFSEVMDRAIKFIDKTSKMNYKLGYQFDDGLYCGKGFIEAVRDFKKDPIRGELRFINPPPFSIMVDPDCYDYDINEGARYLFKTNKYTKKKLKEMYPGKNKVIEDIQHDTDEVEVNMTVMQEGDKDNYGNDANAATIIAESEGIDSQADTDFPDDKKFTHKEYWYKKVVTKYFVVDRTSGEPAKFDKKDEAEAFAKAQIPTYLTGEGVKAPGQFEGDKDIEPRKTFERQVDEMWVAAMVGGHILQNSISPFEPEYSGFSIFRFIADWARSAVSEKLRVQGITRPLKDPQREKNKAKSQYLHILNTTANSGWIGDADALTDTGWADLEKLGAQAGIVIKKKKGSELNEIQPKAPALAHIQREKAADEEFKQDTGLNPDVLGMQDRTQSGRAIALRIKQAVLVLVRIFANYRYTKEILGKFLLAMFPQLFDAKKLAKVIGQKLMGELKITEGILQAYLAMIKDSKYDVMITEADKTTTARYETLETLIELVKTPGGAVIPMDLIIDYMDLPNSEDIKKRIQESQQQALEAQRQKAQK